MELYDLRQDPWQLDNRAAAPAYARVRAALHARLNRLRRCRGRTCREPAVDPVPAG